MFDFTQGAIINGIRSNKYPNTKCYGIIISARCDIANCKVPHFYYLTALNISEWLKSKACFEEALSTRIKSAKKEFEKCSNCFELNPELLIDFKLEDFKKVEESVTANECNGKKKTDLINAYNNYHKIQQIIIDSQTRNNAIKEYKKDFVSLIKRINKGELIHYFYLPTLKLIIDLYEVDKLPMEIAVSIIKNEVDYKYLRNVGNEKADKLKNLFWLENEKDYSLIENIIKPPYIELILQRFAHAFTRIGIDTISDNDIEKMIDNITVEEVRE